MSGYRLVQVCVWPLAHDWVPVPVPWSAPIESGGAVTHLPGTYVQCSRCAKHEFHVSRFYPVPAPPRES